MKYVRIVNNVVAEVIPESATNPNIAFWYDEEFAKQCIDAPDDVMPRWAYNPATRSFSPPVLTHEPTINVETVMLQTLVELEYKILLLENDIKL